MNLNLTIILSLNKLLLFFLLCGLSFFSTPSRGQGIINIDKVVTDSSLNSAQHRLEKLIDLHPFVHNKIVIELGNPNLRKGINKTSLFFTALLCLFLFAGIKIVFERHVLNLIRVFTLFHISKRQLKDQLENDNRASLVFSLLYFMSTGYLLFVLIKKYSFHFQENSNFLAMLMCIGISGGLYIVKIGLIKWIAWVFQYNEAASQYVFNSSIVQEFATLFLFPICIILYVTQGNLNHWILMLGLIIFCIMLIFKYIRLSGILKNLLRFDLIHFLLYICAFEIVPILTLAKMAL